MANTCNTTGTQIKKGDCIFPYVKSALVGGLIGTTNEISEWKFFTNKYITQEGIDDARSLIDNGFYFLPEIVANIDFAETEIELEDNNYGGQSIKNELRSLKATYEVEMSTCEYRKWSELNGKQQYFFPFFQNGTLGFEEVGAEIIKGLPIKTYVTKGLGFSANKDRMPVKFTITMDNFNMTNVMKNTLLGDNSMGETLTPIYDASFEEVTALATEVSFVVESGCTGMSSNPLKSLALGDFEIKDNAGTVIAGTALNEDVYGMYTILATLPAGDYTLAFATTTVTPAGGSPDKYKASLIKFTVA